MFNLKSNNRGSLKPQTNSYDYISYLIMPTTASLKSTPLINAYPQRTSYLESTMNKNAFARSNLILSFGKNKNCKQQFYKVNSNGALLPKPPSNVKVGIRTLAVDAKGDYYISHFGKNYKVKFGKNGRYFNYGKEKIYF